MQRMLNDQEFSCIPTPTEKALISGAVTTLPALVANTPSTVEKAALPGLIANGPTAGEKASFANIPSAGEKAGLVNLPSAGEKAALPNIPSAADKAFLARQQGILPVCLPIYQNMSAAEVMFAYLGGTLTTPDAVATGVSTSGVNLTSGTYDGTKLMSAIIQPSRRIVA